MADYCVKGFKTAGRASGIKPDQKKDLGLIVSDCPASVAGVFTRNQIQAAPVILDRERIAGGVGRALIVNSGIANCCTGKPGMKDAIAVSKMAAASLRIIPDQVLVASTGVIGPRLPMEKIEAAVPELVAEARPTGFADFAEAIMTTDTVPKLVTRQAFLGKIPFTVTGVAKGSGMIHPDMATLLAFICTDMGATAQQLQGILKTGVDETLNRMTIDGDTSTNDTTLLFANGRSGAALDDKKSEALFNEVVRDVLGELAEKLVEDGEGATKRIQITVRGARSEAAAHVVANTIAGSALVKTAFFGEDANWGRVVAAVGRAGVPIEPERLEVFFGDVLVFAGGGATAAAEDGRVAAILQRPHCTIIVDLGMGPAEVSVYTCDLSVEYVKINADYRT
ncbi:MAG: ornithine acetyltransferase [Deltaproteobacteria bacterium]|nr:MAG: ornithine acetyltransferase [Deltaproteobacteria bacterium]